MQPVPFPRRHLGRRWTARFVDWLLVLVVTSPVWVLAIGHLKHSAALTATSFADDGVMGALSARWGDVGDSAYAGVSEVWGSVTTTVIMAAAVQVLAVALYDFVGHAWLGRTVGKAVTSLSVVQVDGARRVRPGRALARAALTVLLPGAGWLVLIAAVLRLDFALGLLGVVLLALSLVECLSLRGPSCWHDRRTGTVVQPVDWAARIAAVRDSAAWGHVQQAPAQAWQQARAVRDRFGGPPGR